MPDGLFLLILVIVIALVYDFVNGMDDCCNAIATVVSTRVLSPRQAILLASTLNVLGAFATTAVAKTIGKGIVEPEIVTQITILSALLGATFWTLICWYLGIPTSVSHALVGGLVGAVGISSGFAVLNLSGLNKIFLAMIFSPVLGFIGGFFLMVGVMWVFRKAIPARVNQYFRGLQVFSSAYMAFSHGTNDTQNAMGIITMALVSYGYLPIFKVPVLVILACGLAMGLGTFVGGWRIIKTMGMRITKLQAVHGFSAETAGATVILGASFLGLPISTTHAISCSILGVGASKRLSAVRWGVTGEMVTAWILTVPGSAVIAAFTFYLLKVFGL